MNTGTFVSAGLPGTGGQIRTEVSDFQVEEILAFEPCGEGEHLFLLVEKTGLPTLEAVRAIGRALKVKESALGYAGMKDARAVTRQWISVHLPGRDRERRLQDAERELSESIRFLHVTSGRAKLRRGELRGNRFEIRIRGAGEGAASSARAILRVLQDRGLPNAFGEQRFGARGHTAMVGWALVAGDAELALDCLLGEPRDDPTLAEGRRISPWLKEALLRYKAADFAGAWASYPPAWKAERQVLARLKDGASPRQALGAMPRRERGLYATAFQAAVFNRCLAERITGNNYDQLLPGDVAYRHGTGETWRIGDPAKEENARGRFEVSPAGPLLGERMLTARGEPAEIENQSIVNLSLSMEEIADGLAKFGLRGERRPYRVPIVETEVREEKDNIVLHFALPPGAYASEVLREVIKNSPPVGEATHLDVPFRKQRTVDCGRGDGEA